jgi:serine/threonine protein kinase
MDAVIIAARAVEPECLELLLAEGASVEQCNDEGSALHMAVSRAVSLAETSPDKYRDALRCVARLARAGADPGLASVSGVSALHSAVTSGNNTCLALLLTLCPSYFLRDAIAAPLPETYSVLDASGRRLATPPSAFYAAASGNLEGLRLLLHRGAPRSFEDRRGVWLHLRDFALVRGGQLAANLVRDIDQVGKASFSEACAELEQSLIAPVPARSAPLPDPPSAVGYSRPSTPMDESPDVQAPVSEHTDAKAIVSEPADVKATASEARVVAPPKPSDAASGWTASGDAASASSSAGWGEPSTSGWGWSAPSSTAEPPAPATVAEERATEVTAPAEPASLPNEASATLHAVQAAKAEVEASIKTAKAEIEAHSQDEALDKAREELTKQQRSHIMMLQAILASACEAQAASEAAAREARANLEALGEGVGGGMQLLNDVKAAHRRELERVAERQVHQLRASVDDVTRAMEATRTSALEDLRLVAEESLTEMRDLSREAVARAPSTGTAAVSSAAVERMAARIASLEAELASVRSQLAAAKAASLGEILRVSDVSGGDLRTALDQHVTSLVDSVIRRRLDKLVDDRVRSAVSHLAPPVAQTSSAGRSPALTPQPSSVFHDAIRGMVDSLSSLPPSAVQFRVCSLPLRVARLDLEDAMDVDDDTALLMSKSEQSLLQRQAHNGVEVHLAMVRTTSEAAPARAVVKCFPRGTDAASQEELRVLLSEYSALQELRGHPNVLNSFGVLQSPSVPFGLVMQEAGAFFVTPRALLSVFAQLLFDGPFSGIGDDGATIAVVGTRDSPFPDLALPSSTERTISGVNRIVDSCIQPLALCSLSLLSTTSIMKTQRFSLSLPQLIAKSSPSAWPYHAPVYSVRSLLDLALCVWRCASDTSLLLSQLLDSVSRAATSSLDEFEVEDVSTVLQESRAITSLSSSVDAATVCLSWKMLPLRDRLLLLASVANGVAFLHSKGILHRDLKLANVFLDGPIPRVGDLGTAKAWVSTESSHAEAPPELSRLASSSSSTDGSAGPFLRFAVGTDAYIAPEVWSRALGAASSAPDAAADVWSFGMTLMAMLDLELCDPLERVVCRSGLDGTAVHEVLLDHRVAPSLLDLLDDKRLPSDVTAAVIADPSTQWGATQALLGDCLQFDPLKRPSMDELHESLCRIAEM